MIALKCGKAGIQPDYFFIIIMIIGMPVHPLYYYGLRLFDGLAGLIIYLDRPPGYCLYFGTLRVRPIGPPPGRAWWFLRFWAQLIVYGSF